MSTSTVRDTAVTVAVENIGGIDETELELPAEHTLLTGRNATNRTSFLRAMMAALGSDDVALKGDAERGSVTLTVGDETYTRTLSRRPGTVVFDGEPYLDESVFADLFAFLLESNDARQAVERGADLYDVIMQPVDTTEIDDEIDSLEAERSELEDQLEELESQERELPELERRRAHLEETLEQKRNKLEQEREALEALKGNTGDPSPLEEQFEELREARNGLEEARTNLDEVKRVINALEEELTSLESDLTGLAEADNEALQNLEKRVGDHRDQIEVIESTLNELQSVVQFNESLLEETQHAGLQAIHSYERSADVAITDQLLGDDEQLVCWTCGSQVDRERVEQTLELLQELYSDRIEERNRLREEVQELEAERNHLERTRDRRRELRREIDQIEQDLEERRVERDELDSRIGELKERIDELEEEIETDDAHEQRTRLQQFRQVNEFEFEIDRLESELETVGTKIETVETRLEERDQIEAQISDIEDDIEDLRSRIERLEVAAVERFNEEMDHIIDLLEFENLERVWVERLEREVREGRDQVSETTFGLHVVRSTTSGSVYEDSVDHLSESEREVVGLVFALSGYLVHEVYDRVPFVLLDSLEAVDADRIATIIDYVAEYAPKLVVALLPEDAAAVDDDYTRITEI